MSDFLSGKVTKRMLFATVLPFALMTASIQAMADGQWGSGKNLYDKLCGLCHAPNVGVGPVIAGRDVVEPESHKIVVVHRPGELDEEADEDRVGALGGSQRAESGVVVVAD